MLEEYFGYGFFIISATSVLCVVGGAFFGIFSRFGPAIRFWSGFRCKQVKADPAVHTRPPGKFSVAAM